MRQSAKQGDALSKLVSRISEVLISVRVLVAMVILIKGETQFQVMDSEN